MNISKHITLCLFAGLLVSFGQPEGMISTAAAAPQLGGCDECGVAAGFQGRTRAGCRCRKCVRCPECTDTFVPPARECCELEIREGKTDKSCFFVDYKTICIPKIVPPWRQCCEPKCAEARSVKVLRKKTYTCPSCDYSWKVVKPQLPTLPEVQAAPSAQNTPRSGYYYQQPTTSAGTAGSDYYTQSNRLWQQPGRQQPQAQPASYPVIPPQQQTLRNPNPLPPITRTAPVISGEKNRRLKSTTVQSSSGSIGDSGAIGDSPQGGR